MGDILTISDTGIKRFCYCPRWYYLDYVIGFHPKSPVKAKFIIHDALMASLASNDIKIFMTRCEALARSEELVEEDVDSAELFARGELLAEELLKWKRGLKNIVWQEQLVKYEHNGVFLESYPALVATQNDKQNLFHFRTAYETLKPMDILGYAYATILQQKGLIAANVSCDQGTKLVSAILRTRKERYSARAKTPLVEIQESDLLFNEFYMQQFDTIIEAIKASYASMTFPALGVIYGTCVWCPNGRVLQGKTLCEQDDNTLRALASSSLQRASIERWRSEF